MIDTLTAWRYWLLRPEDPTPILRPFGPHDKTVWERETHAVCRHDPAHTPPHPDCTCGLYAMTLLDVRYSVAARRWLDSFVVESSVTEHFGWSFWVRNRARIRQEWLAEQPKPVIGEIRMGDVVEEHKPQGTGHTSRSWRARSATLIALYVPEDAADTADALTEKYGVPCTVGYPSGWSQDEWDTRSQMAGCRVAEYGRTRYPTYAQFGLYPPADGAAS